jgi:hypothetical protein
VAVRRLRHAAIQVDPGAAERSERAGRVGEERREEERRDHNRDSDGQRDQP